MVQETLKHQAMRGGMDWGRESDSHIRKTWGLNWDLKGAYSFHREFSQDPERKGKEGEGGRERKGEKESEEGDCI